MQTAATLLRLAEYWAYAGLAMAAVFLTVGMDRVEPNARKSFIFRPLLVPGVVLLWPLVAWRWWVLATGRERQLARHRPPRRAHRAAAVALAILLPAILVTGLIVRQDGPWERPAVLLEPPR